MATERRDWTDGPMWLLGYIDNHGAIHTREVRDCGGHTEIEKLSGRCFRWNIWGQDFGPTYTQMAGDSRLSFDDWDTIRWWLEDNGYKAVEDTEKREGLKK